MNATDLMFGDWVTAIKKPFRLIRISKAFCYGKTASGAVVGPFFFEEIKPIPITPEILEKNGFKNDFYEEESVADYHTIRLEGYSLKHKIGKIDGYLVTWCNGGANVTTDLHGCVQKDISYIHELQHALKLCGIEKEITL